MGYNTFIRSFSDRVHIVLASLALSADKPKASLEHILKLSSPEKQLQFLSYALLKYSIITLNKQSNGMFNEVHVLSDRKEYERMRALNCHNNSNKITLFLNPATNQVEGESIAEVIHFALQPDHPMRSLYDCLMERERIKNLKS